MPSPFSMCTGTTPLETHPSWTQVSLAAARGGDGDAFATLVSPHTPRLRRLAHRLTRSPEDAEDVCQESLLKAFTKLGQFEGTKTQEGEFCAWLMRITANCAIDSLRRRKDANRLVPLHECDYLHNKFHDPGVGGWGESPEASCTRQEQLRLVANALAKLPAELRNVCLLRNMMELSTKEVAARLGISAIAVRLRLFRAHGQLREILGRRIVHRRAGRARRVINVRSERAESLN
jgi:RNA polymerase sigma-70 factor, ECF subfamily